MGSDSTKEVEVRDLVDLIVLAALWGGSFLLLRLASPVFGPVFFDRNASSDRARGAVADSSLFRKA